MPSVSTKQSDQWHASIKVWHADPAKAEGGYFKWTWKATGLPRDRAKSDALAVARTFQQAAEQAYPGNPMRADQRAFTLALESIWKAAGLATPQKTATWVEFSPEFVASCNANASTRKLYQSQLDAFGKHLGHKAKGMLHNVTHDDCQRFYDALRVKGRTAKTTRNYLKCVRACFDRAAKLGIIGLNPAALVKTPLGAPGQRHPLTMAEVGAVLAVLDEPPAAAIHCRGFLFGVVEEWRTAVLFGLWCGMRLGDATSREWSDIAGDCETVTFVPQKKQRYGVAVTLPLVGKLREHLLSVPNKEGPITPRLNGHYKLSVNFGKLLNLAGVSDKAPAKTGPSSKPKRHKSFHSLRHTVLTELAKTGADKQLRMLLADHDDPAVNTKYTHGEVARLAEALTKAFPVIDTIKTPGDSKAAD